MAKPKLYRGNWPRNVNKTAKYSVRADGDEWKVTVLYDLGEGLKFLAVESGGIDVPERVNQIKRAIGDHEGGVFYVNEYQHLIVPVGQIGSPHYYVGGRVDCEFEFEFEGERLTTEPLDLDGHSLEPGDAWVGPRPAIPYVLAAGGSDIYYETPALTDANRPSVRPGVTHKVQLSSVLGSPRELRMAIQPVLDVRGHQGGRFYVNEHRAIFTPVGNGDGNGLDYIYCGEVDLDRWFPEPTID